MWYWFWIDAVCSSFGLIHVLRIEQERILVCSSSRHTLMNRILLLLSRHPPYHSAKRACLELQHPLFQCSPSPSCHSARRAYPKLQNLLYLVAKENLLPGEKVPVRADEGWRKRALSRPSPTVYDGPPSPGERGFSVG